MLRGRLLKLAYDLRQHYLGGWSLDRWAATGCLGLPAFLLIQWLLRGRPPNPAWHWILLAALVAVGAGAVVLRAWGERAAYVHFTPDESPSPPEPHALDPADKIALHATGMFRVESKARRAAGLLAYWRTFASREHAVMAIQPPSRFLLLGHVPADDVGMWYIFFRPEAIVSIAPGRVRFGAEESPALRVQHRQSLPARRNREIIVQETAYLAAPEADRDRIWADLLRGG